MTATSSAIESSSRDRIERRRNAVLLLYGLSAFWGIAQVVAPGNSTLLIAGGITFATCATLWFTTDRRIVGSAALPIVQFLFFLTWPVGSLVHLLISRGVRGVGYWLLHAAGLFLTMCLTFYPTMFLLYWLGMLNLDALTKP